MTLNRGSKDDREDEAIEEFRTEDAPDPPEPGDPSLPEEADVPEPPEFDQGLQDFYEAGGTIEEVSDLGGTSKQGEGVEGKLDELLEFLRTGMPELVAEAVRAALMGD